ncbi:metalloregulator ArsR/SmtB family transcription factor [Microbispora sp. NPDC088329]|uniref:metalloregulator ArsR/SmtB family transcription factor n=1 Tax=Microbispora sp. NPDC088329 TaxID=3154869 RepID=UPI0034121A20
MATNRTFEALAHAQRRRVLRLLKDCDRLTAGQLAERLDVPRPTLSGHLNVLKCADLIVGDRKGTTIWYRLNLTVVEEALEAVFSLLGGVSEARARRQDGLSAVPSADVVPSSIAPETGVLLRKAV